MTLTESTVEEAALEWFGELGSVIGYGPEIEPGEGASSATCKHSLQVQSEE